MEAPGELVQALLVTGGVMLNDSLYSYFAFSGGLSPSAPLGWDLTGGQLAPVIRVGLESLDKKGT